MLDYDREEELGEDVKEYATLEALIAEEVKPFIAEQANVWAMYKAADVPLSTLGLLAYQMAVIDCRLLPAELRASSLDVVAKLYGKALGMPIPDAE